MTQTEVKQNYLMLLEKLNKSCAHLKRSYKRCHQVGIKKAYGEDEYDAFENLTSRYGRMVDFILQKIFRAIDEVELEPKGTLIDAVRRAEKRGLISSVDELRAMKDLRNEIVHEYIDDALEELFGDILAFTPKLFELIDNINRYKIL